MKIESLKQSRLKRNIVIGVVVVLIISAIILNFTRAKYRVTESIPLVNGTISHELDTSNLVGIYIQENNGYFKSDTIPDSGFVLNESESYCTVNGEKDLSIKLSYNIDTKSLSVTPMTTKGTKCFLYFDEKLCPDGATACEIILSDKNISSDRNSSISSTLAVNSTGTVYSVMDDYGTSYVYAGIVDNNWVSFAGFYWRIIRINGDGTIRMIYNGSSMSQTGEDTQIRNNIFTFNARSNDNAYVGYMYGTANQSNYANTHVNSNNSSIKSLLDDWYSNNIVDKGYNEFVSLEAGFCNDRRIATSNENFWTSDTKLGYGTNVTAYATFSRLFDVSGGWRNAQLPTLKCSQESNDLFTVSESNNGNHSLEYPVGLITADEVVLAGGFGGSENTNFYLNTGQSYWTMSPSWYTDAAYMFFVYSNGILSHDKVFGRYGIRPVINLRADVTISGSGTTSDPYVIS